MGRKKRRKYQKNQNIMKQVATKRCKELMELALETHSENPELANRYVKHTREIAMAAKIRIPLQYKRNICHGCKSLLIPGKTMRFRTHHREGYGSFLSVTCLNCGHTTRYIFKGAAYRGIKTEKQNLERITKNGKDSRERTAR